jgi:hypothetical protein
VITKSRGLLGGIAAPDRIAAIEDLVLHGDAGADVLDLVELLRGEVAPAFSEPTGA